MNKVFINIQRNLFRIVFYTASLLLAPSVYSASAVHHFTIDLPASIKAGDSFTFHIQAVDERGTVVKDAANACTVSLVSRQETIQQDVVLENGNAIFSATFGHAGNFILSIRDKNEPKLFANEGLRVKPDYAKMIQKEAR